MIKNINFATGRKPCFRYLHRLVAVVLALFASPTNAHADFPLVRHAASGEARAQLNNRHQSTASSQTTDDMDLTMTFVAESSLGAGLPTRISTEGKSIVTVTESKLRTLVRLDASYLAYQGSPGGTTSGTLTSVVEFTMPMEQIPVHITFNRDLHDPFVGTMTFIIENLTTGVTLYLNDGSYPIADDVLEASTGDRISIYSSMSLSGTAVAGSPGRQSRIDVEYEFKIVDCNGNGVYDATDIANGMSTDCDGNGNPDECDLDCNQNGLGDVCDIHEGRSKDCDSNSFPDECDLSMGSATDCNANGLPDACDAGSGLLTDLNGNGFPDVCEFETLYVDATVPPGGDGSSWLLAYNDLQSALQHAANSPGVVQTIKVADGTYRPRRRTEAPDPRSATFSLPFEVDLIGGLRALPTLLRSAILRRLLACLLVMLSSTICLTLGIAQTMSTTS